MSNVQTQTITLTKKGKISNRKCCMDIHLCRLRSTISPYSSSISLKICPENKGGYMQVHNSAILPDITVKEAATALYTVSPFCFFKSGLLCTCACTFKTHADRQIQF